ncbi:hypothetical protein HDE_05693 [Halotydeus destructor]|nr:hypothetical protein HDE_05693 [Halotydeus destructor]
MAPSLLFLCVSLIVGQSVSSPLGFSWTTSPTESYHQFLYFDKLMTFIQALQFCSRHGGQLPMHVDIDQRKWLLEKVSQGQFFWLGAVNVPETAYYANWLDGSYFSWEYDVKDGAAESCSALTSDSDGQLLSVSCTSQARPVCMVRNSA